jgi:hypothetical protein
MAASGHFDQIILRQFFCSVTKINVVGIFSKDKEISHNVKVFRCRE